MPLAAAQDADPCHTETSANNAQEMPSSSKADQRQASAMSATSESSSAASSDLVELRASGMADGHAAYELVRRAASEPSAEFWEMWASRELHWFHASLGAWLSQSADGGWTGWTMDGLPTILGSWQPWEVAVDASEAPHVRWFCGAQTNAAFNEVDRHVLRGHGGEVGRRAVRRHTSRGAGCCCTQCLLHTQCATGCASPHRSASHCTAGGSGGGRSQKREAFLRCRGGTPTDIVYPALSH